MERENIEKHEENHKNYMQRYKDSKNCENYVHNLKNRWDVMEKEGEIFVGRVKKLVFDLRGDVKIK